MRIVDLDTATAKQELLVKIGDVKTSIKELQKETRSAKQLLDDYQEKLKAYEALEKHEVL